MRRFTIHIRPAINNTVLYAAAAITVAVVGFGTGLYLTMLLGGN